MLNLSQSVLTLTLIKYAEYFTARTITAKKIEGYLLSTLNDAQKELYNELQEINTELQGKWEFNAYSLGFVDGIILAGRL